MPATVEKINKDQAATPKTLLGMLVGCSDRITQVVAVVTYDDGTCQLVNNGMKQRDLAFAAAVIQREIFLIMEEDEY